MSRGPALAYREDRLRACLDLVVFDSHRLDHGRSALYSLIDTVVLTKGFLGAVSTICAMLRATKAQAAQWSQGKAESGNGHLIIFFIDQLSRLC